MSRRSEKATDEWLTYEAGAVQTARRKLAMLGLPVPSELGDNERNLVLPWSLSDQSGPELSNLLSGFTRLRGYAKYHAALADANATAAEMELKNETSDQMLTASGGDGDKVTIRRAQVLAMPSVKQLQKKAHHLRTIYRAIQALAEGYDDSYAAVSREISRRDQSGERDPDWSDQDGVVDEFK